MMISTRVFCEFDEAVTSFGQHAIITANNPTCRAMAEFVFQLICIFWFRKILPRSAQENLRNANNMGMRNGTFWARFGRQWTTSNGSPLLATLFIPFVERTNTVAQLSFGCCPAQYIIYIACHRLRVYKGLAVQSLTMMTVPHIAN